MVIAYVPLLFVIIGLLLYGLANGKISAIGFAIFQCAFLVLMFSLAGKAVRLLS